MIYINSINIDRVFFPKRLTKVMSDRKQKFCTPESMLMSLQKFHVQQGGGQEEYLGFSEGHGGTWYRVTCNPPRISL